MSNDAKDALSARIEKLGGASHKKAKEPNPTQKEPKKKQKETKRKLKGSSRKESAEKKEDALSARMGKTENKQWGKKLIISLIVTAVTVYLLFGVIFGIAHVKGDSMTPAYKNGDYVLFLRVVPKYKMGNVVLIKTEAGEENIKRLIGEPNSTIKIDGDVYINDMKLKETYIYEKTDAKEGVTYPLTLSENEYFVLGDNRGNSKDSRNYGAVEKKNIKGKALTVLRFKG